VVAQRRAEQEAGGVQRALYPGLAATGWQQTRFGLQHPVAKTTGHIQDQPNHPYLRLLVDRRSVGVLAWHWGYNRFDINAFVDSQRASFEAVSVLPPRKAFSEKSAALLANFRKEGEVAYLAGRPINDTRWVLLWKADSGWANVDADWVAISREIASRTGAWVRLLAEAVASCLGIERDALSIVGGA
jgi:hypothetical protein